MSEQNKLTLLNGNAEIARENYEGFLDLCTEDTTWEFVGDVTLRGKKEVRKWMQENYKEPPTVTVDHLLPSGNFLTAIGTVTMKNTSGRPVDYHYSDTWEFRGELMHKVTAFVIEKK